MNQVQMAITGF